MKWTVYATILTFAFVFSTKRLLLTCFSYTRDLIYRDVAAPNVSNDLGKYKNIINDSQIKCMLESTSCFCALDRSPRQNPRVSKVWSDSRREGKEETSPRTSSNLDLIIFKYAESYRKTRITHDNSFDLNTGFASF